MKKILRKFETSMMAAAFAEAGEFETACRILTEAEENEERRTARPALHERAAQGTVLKAK